MEQQHGQSCELGRFLVECTCDGIIRRILRIRSHLDYRGRARRYCSDGCGR
jgi:hypothetical protein